MNNFFIKPDEVVEIIKKRYEEKANNGEEINFEEISNEEINNFVINSETERFNDLFNRVFDEIILTTAEDSNLDSEDGPVNEICREIITKIKNSFEKVDKVKLLNIIIKIFKELLIKKEE